MSPPRRPIRSCSQPHRTPQAERLPSGSNLCPVRSHPLRAVRDPRPRPARSRPDAASVQARRERSRRRRSARSQRAPTRLRADLPLGHGRSMPPYEVRVTRPRPSRLCRRRRNAVRPPSAVRSRRRPAHHRGRRSRRADSPATSVASSGPVPAVAADRPIRAVRRPQSRRSSARHAASVRSTAAASAL